MRTTTLIKNTFRAIVFPHRVFKEIKPDDRINYKVVIPLIILLSAAMHQLHLTIVFGQHFLMGGWALFSLLAPIYFMAFWLGGSMIFHLLATIFKKDVRFQSIEIGVFYILMIFIVMPLLDLPHLFGLEMRSYFLFGTFQENFRFSVIPKIILIIIGVFFLSKCLLKFKGVVAFLLALLVPFAGKVFVTFTVRPEVPVKIFDLLNFYREHFHVILGVIYLLPGSVLLSFAILYRRHIIKIETRNGLMSET